jgi:hypothetical protein
LPKITTEIATETETTIIRASRTMIAKPSAVGSRNITTISREVFATLTGCRVNWNPGFRLALS